MDQTTQTTSALRHRMIEDMRMRKLSPKTQSHYIRAVRQFAKYLGRSPDTATAEDLRGYQLHLADRGVSSISINAAITGLKFFFEVTLGQPRHPCRRGGGGHRQARLDAHPAVIGIVRSARVTPRVAGSKPGRSPWVH